MTHAELLRVITYNAGWSGYVSIMEVYLEGYKPVSMRQRLNSSKSWTACLTNLEEHIVGVDQQRMHVSPDISKCRHGA